jgi:aminoglycoside phosphotransferase (APT) family kinase protein
VTRGLDLDRARAWLADALDVDDPATFTAQQIPGGRSNLTFLLASGSRQWILRRPPLGDRLPTAHSMRREYRVLDALAPSAVPVPRPCAMCDDEDLIGAPFYVMERVEGRVIRHASETTDLTPDQARACSLALVDTLAALHTAPYAELGLVDFGRPTGYMERQVERWHDQLQRSRVRPLPALDELGARLRNVPAAAHAAILHGDYRIDNVLLDPADPGRIAAVLDWEMATLGDPLADLGMLLMYWGQAGERYAHEIQAVTARPGFLTRAEVADRYAQQTGWTLDALDFYVAFAHFKLAVIVEGIVARQRAGDTVGAGFEGIDQIAPALATRGLEVVP